MSRPRPPGRAQRAERGEGGAHDGRRARADRPRPPCSGVKCGAVQPASATMLPPLVDRRARDPSARRASRGPRRDELVVDLSRRSSCRRSPRPPRPEQLEAVVAHDLADLVVVEAVELLGEVERLGQALAVRPVGAEQDPLDADEIGQRVEVLLAVRRRSTRAGGSSRADRRRRPTASGWPACAAA